MMAADSDPRAEFIAGLHALADFYTAHPDFPLPYEATYSDTPTFNIHVLDSDDFGPLVRQLGGGIGETTKNPDDDFYKVVRSFGGRVTLRVLIRREKVGAKTQVGTVTEMRPDPSVEVPMVAVEVPVYAYECGPILDSSPTERIVDLMANLEDSINEAKAARDRKRADDAARETAAVHSDDEQPVDNGVTAAEASALIDDGYPAAGTVIR